MGISEELKAAQEIQQINIKVRRAWGVIFSSWYKKGWLMIKHQKKQLFTTLVAIAAVAACVWMGFKYVIFPDIEMYKIEQVMSKELPDSVYENIGINKGNLDFMLALAQVESGGKWDIVGGSGNAYIGAFQFGPVALRAVGLENIDKKLFLNDPRLQMWAMNSLMKKNYIALSKLISEKQIPMQGGVKIGRYIVTVSGLLAAAHLVGASSVKDFINSNGTDIAKDGNGVPLTDYFQFNNFIISF